MQQEIKVKLELRENNSNNAKNLIETELEVLNGVDAAIFNEENHEVLIRFDNSVIGQQELSKKIGELGFLIENEQKENHQIENPKEKIDLKEYVYFVKGMHCASCELMIEKKLLAINGIEAAEASTSKGQVLIECNGTGPSAERLNSIFRKEGYTFSNNKTDEGVSEIKKGGFFSAITTALIIIAGFLALNKLGLGGLVSVSSGSSLPLLFVLGLLAGVSSCAALVGGLVLSMSKQWLQLYPNDISISKKMQPHIMFNVGRVLSYFLFGAILAVIGSKFQFSTRFTSLIIISVSALMVLIALQMLGVKSLRKFQISLPKSATRYIANESNFKAKYMPFFMGALTLLLPCGFTITVEGLALLSGNPLLGAFMMALFALGTAPALLAIGLSGVMLSKKPHIAEKFSKVAGIVIIFFAVFNINAQMNVLGLTSLDDIKISSSQTTNKIDQSNLAPIVDGKQVLKMTAYASSDSPNYFKVRAGMPVRWEITAGGSLGCNGAIISNSLFSGSIDLTPGQISIKEFTPTTPGRYKFSCTMGMISGVIEVIDANSVGSAAPSGNSIATTNTQEVPSGAKGCGCGGGGGSCGGQ